MTPSPRKKRPTDKEMLDWLSKQDVRSFGTGYLWVCFLPTDLENGQTLRGSIDAAMRKKP